MKHRVLLALALSLSLPSVGFAEKKTDEQYWTETGITTAILAKSLSPQMCYRNVQTFKGCVAVLNNVAARLEPAARLVPTSVVEDRSLGFGQTLKTYVGLTLVTVPELKRDAGSFRQTWAQEELKRTKSEAAEEGLFQFRQQAQIDFAAILADLVPQAVKDPKSDALVAGEALSSYFGQAVDAHARIQPTAQLNDSVADADESFAGIGASIQELNSLIIIPSVIEGSPAEKGGVKAQDVIVAVDGKSTVGMKADAVVKLIRGPVGTRVTVRVRRDGKELDIPLVRGTIKQENVESKVVEDMGRKVGYIRLRSFMDRNACSTMNQKITHLQTVDKVEGLVLDLRQNGGGLLDQAVCIGGLFVGQKVIVQVRDLSNNNMQPQVSSQAQVTKLPLVVLVDGGSASASEVLSGALQDHQRAWIVGERSFGKGSVQAPTPFPGNSRLVIFATIQRFYQPLGRTNQVVGIWPSFTRPFKPEATDDERFSLREKNYYPNALDAESKDWVETRPAQVAKINSCVDSQQGAQRLYTEAKSANRTADYQLYSAEEVLSCDRQ